MEVATTTTEATLSAIHESLAQLYVKLGRIAARQDEMLVDLKKTTAALMPNGAIATTTPIFEPGRVLEQQTTKPSSSSLFSASQVVGSGARLADAVIAAAMPTGCSTKGHGHYIDKGRAELVSPSWGNTQAEVRVPCEPSLDRSPQPCVAHKLSMSTTPTHLTKCILDNTNVQSSAVVEEATPGLSMNAALLNDTALGCTLPATALPVGRDTCNTAQTLDGMVEEEVFTTVGGLSLFSELCVDASVPWDPGKQEAVIKGLFCLQTHAERCVSQCNLYVISILRKDAKIMQVATDPILKKMSSWRRSGFSPGNCMQPHLGITPSSRSNVSPDCLPIILAKFDRCSVEWLAPHKCIVNVAKAAVCILINLTLGDVFCLRLKIFKSAVSPVDMIQKLYLANNIQSYEGSVWTVANQHTFLVNSQYTVQLHGHLMSRYRCLIFVLLMRSSQPMVQVTKILAYFRWLEVQMIYRSVIIFLVDFSLVVAATTATESEKHFRHVTLKYRNVHWNGLLVHQIQQEACSRCFFHMQSRLFGFDIHQLCNMKTHDGIPWDPGGIHGSRILAIAWGQAMFCPGGSVTPRVYAGMGLACWWLYMGLGQLVNTWIRKIKGNERHGRGHGRNDLKSETLLSVPFVSLVPNLSGGRSPQAAYSYGGRSPQAAVSSSSRSGDLRQQRGVTIWYQSHEFPPPNFFPIPHSMEVATTTTEATLSAIHESLAQLYVKLGRIAARQETMLADLKKTTAALAPTAATTPVFMLGRVPEQQATKPSSPSIISAHRVVATAALQTGTVLTSFAPTRYSTICSTVNVGSNHGAVAFPISGTELKVDDKLTHVGGFSLFLELDLDSANKVFEDDGFTTVGGVSLFLDLEMKFEVLTWVGDCSIFLEPGMGNPTEMVAAPSNVDMDKVFDPGGSRFLCWVLHNKIVAANITLSFLNLLIHLHVWEDGRSTALAMELYVQWDPGIIENVLMTAMFVQLAQKTESKEKKIYAKFFVSSRVEVNPDCLSIILAKFDTCSVEWYASYKCIFNITQGVVCILLSLTLSDVVCMIQESFGLSPLDMFQNLYLGTNIHIYEGSVCRIVVEFKADKQHTFGGNSQCAVQLHGHFMLGCPCLISVRLERTSQYMVLVMEVLAYWCSVEVQATYPSANAVLVDFSLVPRSTAATALTGLFQCVNLQNQIGQWDSLFQEGMVHRNQLKAGSGCYFHMQSRSFGFNIPQICNVSTLDGLPWDPGGVHISKIHAIAWGQAIFCGGGRV